MQVSVKSDISAFTKALDAFGRNQIPFATAKSLTQVAADASRKRLPVVADKTFDKGATRFTKRGFKYIKATKRNLVATVFIDNIQNEYMKFQVKGGTRFPERKSLLISTDASRVNRFGNLTPATLSRMINDKYKYFKGVPRGKTGQNYEGIWERYGRQTRRGGQRIRMVARYVDKAQYRPLFPFAETIEGVVFSGEGKFANRFRANLRDALRQTRPRRGRLR